MICRSAICFGQFNAQRLDLPEQRALVDAEGLGGCQPIPLVPLQGPQDDLLLSRLECCGGFGREKLHCHGRLQFIRQMARLYHSSRA
jgi:hypothetical protein